LVNFYKNHLTEAPSIRLFDIKNKENYAFVNYIPSLSSIEVNLLYGVSLDKHLISINQRTSIESLIIVWKAKQLTIFINCQYAGAANFTSPEHLNLLSLPSVKPKVFVSAGQLFSTFKEALFIAKCINKTSSQSFPLVNYMKPPSIMVENEPETAESTRRISTNLVTHQLTSTTTTTTVKTVTKNRMGTDHLEKNSSTSQSPISLKQGSVISNQNKPVDPTLLDAEFLQLVYMSRIAQYENLVSLQHVLTKFKIIKERLLNMTTLNCY
jgi:hypothetical protein